MHPLVKNTIKFFLFLAVSAFLFWLVYRDQNWDELLTVLKEDVNYFWIGVACVMGIASHVSRALRWQLLTASMGYRISFGNSFMGVMIGYFANLAIPRMGEFTRCGVVSKYEEVPFSKLLGTVVTERVIDMMILLFLTLIVVITQFKQVGIFLDNNQEIEEKVVNMFHSSWMLLVLVVLAAVGWLFWRLIRKTRFKERIHSFFKGLKEGLLSVKDVRHKGLFVFYSLFIWLMYFLMFYVCFFCFQFTSHLGALVGLTIFVLSSYGMVAPVQGGIGAWHFMVIAALMIYLPHTPNIESMAKTFALLTHGTMTLLYIVVGVICVILLPLYNNAAGKQGNVLVSVGKIKVFAVSVFFLGINLCPFAVDFLMRIHIYFIHQFVLIFDTQDQLVGRQVGIAVDDGSVGIIAISPDKGRASGQQGGTENNKQIEEIFFCINNLRCRMFDFVKVISANNGCIFSFFVTFGKYFLSVYGM